MDYRLTDQMLIGAILNVLNSVIANPSLLESSAESSTYAVLFDDPDHSIGEERFLIIGMLKSSKICIVSHCYRDNDNII